MNFFRRHLDSKISKAIALIIIVIFVGWEFISQGLKKSDSWLFKVGDIEYTTKDWQEAYKIITNDPISSQEAIANPSYAKKRVLEEMIRNALILQESQDVGFSISDKMVASEVAHMKIFKGEDGKFDKNLLEKTLEKNNLTEADFVRRMKEQLLRNQFMDLFYNTSGIMAKPLYDLVLKMIAAEQNITLYTLQTIDEKISYDDKELEEYMNDNKEKFTKPDEAEVSIADFNSKMINEKDLVPTEQEINDHHDKNSEFEPEKRLVQQIVISSHNDAQKVLEKIKNGQTSFDDAAKIYLEKQVIPFEIGPFVAEGFDPDIANVIFTLPEKEISELVQTPLGWHLFRVAKIFPQRKLALAETKEKILKAIVDKKIADRMREMVKNIMNDIEGDKTLEEIGDKYSLKISNRVEKSLIDSSQNPIENGIPRIKLLNTIFKSDSAETRLITSQDNKSFTLVRVNKITPGEVMDFSSSKDKIAKDYIKTSLDKKTHELLKNLRDQVLDNKEIHDSRVKKTFLRLSRLKDNAEMPDCIRRTLFDFYKSGVFEGATAPCKTDNSYSFAKLNSFDFEVKPSDEDEIQLKQVVHSVYNDIVFDQLMSKLKSKYEVKLSEQFIKYINE